RAGGLRIGIAGDLILALQDAQALAPHAHIGRIDRAMRDPARARVVVPGPECRIVDLEAHRAAQARALHGRGIGNGSLLHPNRESQKTCVDSSTAGALRSNPGKARIAEIGRRAVTVDAEQDASGAAGSRMRAALTVSAGSPNRVRKVGAVLALRDGTEIA